MKRQLPLVAKDARRFWLPATVWFAFNLGAAIWFYRFPVSVRADMPTLSGWCGLLAVLQGILAFILIASLVLEDSFVGTTAFWMTRPIPRSRLLLSKVLAAIVVIALGIAGAGIVLLAGGANLLETSHALRNWVIAVALVLVAAVVFASVSRSLAACVLAVIATLVVWCAVAVLVPALAGPARLTTDLVPNPILFEALPIALGLAFVARFVLRNSAWAWGVMAVFFVVGFGVTIARPRVVKPQDPAPKVEPVTVSETTTATSALGSYSILHGIAARRDDGTYHVPVAILSPQPVGMLSCRDVARRLALDPNMPAIAWAIPVTSPLGGQQAFAVFGDPIVLGAVRLDVDSTLRWRTGRLKLLTLVQNPAGSQVVVVQQTEVGVPAKNFGRFEYVYVWVNRKAHRAAFMEVGQEESAWFAGQLQRVVHLSIGPELVKAVGDADELAVVHFPGVQRQFWPAATESTR